MRKRILSWALISAACAVSATAQVRLDRLEVVLWPEYDRSSVLVILRADLSVDTALPAIVPLPMPTSVGTPHAVAKRGPNGNLLVAQYSIETSADWSSVKVLTDSPTIRLEYYVPLATTDAQRSYHFYWPPGLAVNQVAYEVLHPTGATNMTVTPPADGAIEANGLTFYRAELGPRPGSESFSITLAYAKETTTLSSPASQAAPQVAVAQPAVVAQSESTTSSLNWVPLALIALAVAIGLWLMFRRPQQPSKD